MLAPFLIVESGCGPAPGIAAREAFVDEGVADLNAIDLHDAQQAPVRVAIAVDAIQGDGS